jgi:hypothetical protein
MVGLALLLVTTQLSGAVTVKANSALRSGWSKHAQTRRASSGSNVVQTYTCLSDGSTHRFTPAPCLVERWTDWTTSVLSGCRSTSVIRPSATAAVGMSAPLSVADSTSAMQSTNVDAPGLLHEKAMVDTARKASPSTRSVRSTAMSYRSTVSRPARSAASSRVRLSSCATLILL